MRRKASYLLPGIVEVMQTPVVPEEGFRLGVTGGRDFDDSRFVWDTLMALHRRFHITELGSGCAEGVDTFAIQWANRYRVPWRCYVADWKTYGDAAGAIRNGVYLEDFQPELLAVFPGGRGTTDCARKARKMEIEREFFDPETDPLKEALRWG